MADKIKYIEGMSVCGKHLSVVMQVFSDIKTPASITFDALHINCAYKLEHLCLCELHTCELRQSLQKEDVDEINE